MTTPNQNQNIESEIVDGALENEEMTEEQLESVAGGKKRKLHTKNVASGAGAAASAVEVANHAHQIHHR